MAKIKIGVIIWGLVSWVIAGVLIIFDALGRVRELVSGRNYTLGFLSILLLVVLSALLLGCIFGGFALIFSCKSDYWED